MPEPQPFPAPSPGFGAMLDRMACTLFRSHASLTEYVAWAVDEGIFSVLEATPGSTVEEVAAKTNLSEGGADALLGILCSIGLAHREGGSRHTLTEVARAYFSPDAPYFVGGQLCVDKDTPPFFLRSFNPDQRALDASRFSSEWLLRNQHVRNLPACVAAVKTGEFEDVETIVDVAGGSGTFSIPLACEYPTKRIILTDLPQSLPNMRKIVAENGLEGRIEVAGLDAFEVDWTIPECDGIFIGNFLHGFDEETCISVLLRSRDRLRAGGKVWLHEMLWDDDKNGPLLTALYNVIMRQRGGTQRSGPELEQLLQRAGFTDTYTVPTLGVYSLVAGTKPQ